MAAATAGLGGVTALAAGGVCGRPMVVVPKPDSLDFLPACKGVKAKYGGVLVLPPLTIAGSLERPPNIAAWLLTGLACVGGTLWKVNGS